MSGTVRDLNTGIKVGETDDLEATFLAAVRAAWEKEPCYVVVGTGSSPTFEERLAVLGVPVVHDPGLPDAALIVSGRADEWEPLSGGSDQATLA